MTILAVILFWIGLAAPILNWYDDRSELLRRQEAMARRMTSLVATLPDLEREASTLNVSSGTDVAGAMAGLLPGSSDALAAASLQQRIDELAAKAGARVASEEILPAQNDGDLRAISVRLTVTARYSAAVGFLLALAQSDVPIVVDELMIRGSPGRPTTGESPVDANLTVTSYRSMKAEAK
jgi:general secretion pathway protein M